MTRIILAILVLWTGVATAKDTRPPKRQIPPEVISGLRLLTHEFSRALAQDCAAERCFAKGCVYVGHTVVDQPATGSLPGLHLDPGPGTNPSQIFLTTAQCSFAYERSVSARDARALTTRLKAKVSKGWTTVEVVAERLKPLPDFLRDPPERVEAPPEVFDAPPEATEDAGVEATGEPAKTWVAPVAALELWAHLLPHFSWMIALIMLTLAALLVIWAARRLGRVSPEEQLLLAQMMNETQAPSVVATDTEPVEDAQRARVAERLKAWRVRLSKMGATETDPALQALVRDLLRTGQHRLLAKAVTLFPEDFAKAFPTDGSLVSAKFEVAEVLKRTDPAMLPADEVFFDTLDRYALASLLTAHPDTDLIRSLHDDFGVKALVDVVGTIPARHGALLFALAPDAMRHEAVDLLDGAELARLADQLMRSNRMDPTETAYLLDVLAALDAGRPLPASPPEGAVSDRGTEFSATAALSALLPRLDGSVREALVEAAAQRHNGRLPTWMRGTLYAEMLLKLDEMTRVDLLLEVEVEALSAWLQAQVPEAKMRLLDAAPTSLRAALSGVAVLGASDTHFAQVNAGRVALSSALLRRLRQGDIAFRTLLA